MNRTVLSQLGDGLFNNVRGGEGRRDLVNSDRI